MTKTTNECRCKKFPGSLIKGRFVGIDFICEKCNAPVVSSSQTTQTTPEIRELLRALSGYYHLGLNDRDLVEVTNEARAIFDKYSVLHKAKEMAKNEW